MRRPLKPFITEYKGTARRQPSGVNELALSEPKRPVQSTPDFSLRPDSDDSYEAALRAADALFAAPGQVEPDASGDVSPVGDADSATSKNGGRILRVLDEAPPPELVALEVEHAPKRRGRKPGSKNKPKPLVALTSDTVEAPETELDFEFDPPAMPATEARMPTVRRIEALPSDGAPARPPKKNAWMRDRLRPGEEWKRRRLPRVCW